MLELNTKLNTEMSLIISSVHVDD